MTIATATDVQNNFGKYLNSVQMGDEIIIIRNGKEVARLISHDKSVRFLTDSLMGVLHGDYDGKDARSERLARYESID